jgi:hypothetical protein
MTPWLLTLPFLAQGAVMGLDEGWFHRRRGLPRWERIGHPLDSLTVAACFAWVVLVAPEAPGALTVYVVLAVVSCLFVTKDEVVHKRLCSAPEGWLHALLFVLHPIVLFAAALLWRAHALHGALVTQLVLVSGFAVYQAVYWGPWNRTPTLSAT